MPTQTSSNVSEPAVNMLPCVQVCGDLDTQRRVVWINPATISYFAEYLSVQDGEPGPRWTAVYLISNHRMTIDASPEQFAGWLRGDQPQEAPCQQRPRSHWDFVDEDGCLHCNCGHGVVAP